MNNSSNKSIAIRDSVTCHRSNLVQSAEGIKSGDTVKWNMITFSLKSQKSGWWCDISAHMSAFT